MCCKSNWHTNGKQLLHCRNECVCVCAHGTLVFACVTMQCFCTRTQRWVQGNSGADCYSLRRCVFDLTAALSCIGHLVMWRYHRSRQTFWLVGHNVLDAFIKDFMSVEIKQRLNNGIKLCLLMNVALLYFITYLRWSYYQVIHCCNITTYCYFCYWVMKQFNSIAVAFISSLQLVRMS